MGKYEPLQRYLETRGDDSWEAGFADIEQILGFGLPKSAYTHYAWWANASNGSHSHAKSWQEAGWNTRDVNLDGHRVRFERSGRVRSTLQQTAKSASDGAPANLAADLAPMLDLACTILRISDHHEVMRIALESLIRRSASMELAALGGSMPDLQLPERERPEI